MNAEPPPCCSSRAKRFSKPTWMTEICCYKGSGGVAAGFGAQFDPTMTQGLWLADQIYDDLVTAGDSAWYWWTALLCAARLFEKMCVPSFLDTKYI